MDLALEQETAIQNILVELLQDNGGKTKEEIQSTIFHAAEFEDIEAVKSILDNGFDMSGTDDEGYNVRALRRVVQQEKYGYDSLFFDTPKDDIGYFEPQGHPWSHSIGPSLCME